MKRIQDLKWEPPQERGSDLTSHELKSMKTSRGFNRLSKLLCLVLLNALFAPTTNAQDTSCRAGYSCVRGVIEECEPGWYSLEGQKECKRCPHGNYLILRYLQF